MKKAKVSSLFLILIFYSYQFIGQEKVDSLSYYSNLVHSPKKDSDLSRAYNFYNNYYKNAFIKGDTISAIYAMRYIASIEYKTGAYYDSEEITIKALKLSDKLKSNSYLENLKKSIFNHLGIIYRKQGNFKKAIDLYNRALNLAQNQKDSAGIFNNIANIYKDNLEYRKAKEYTLKAYSIVKESKDTLFVARILDNLGFIKMKLKNNGAYKDLISALKLRKQKNNISTIYTSYSHLAQYHKEKKENKKAREYALKANKIAKMLNSSSYKKDALGLLLDLSNDVYAKQYKLLNDSINIAEQKSSNKFALIKYDLAKQEELTRKSELKTEREKLKTEKEKSKRLISQFIGLLLFISIIFLFFFLRFKFKKNLVETILKTEGRISKKVHDVVANDIYQTMTKLQSNINSKESILDDLEDIYNKTREISKENSTLDVNENFNELLTDLLLSYKSNNVNVITNNISKIDWHKVSFNKKTAIYRVLQELMTNMKKHSKATIVVLIFKQNKNKIVLRYNDNGIGTENKKHNGLENAENRINSVKGTLTFESHLGKGFKATITV